MATSRRGPNPTSTGTESDLEGLTVEELQDRAAEADVEGRSSMNKDELVEALRSESDVLRVESSESDGSDWPANREDGNPFSYGGKKY